MLTNVGLDIITQFSELSDFLFFSFLPFHTKALCPWKEYEKIFFPRAGLVFDE